MLRKWRNRARIIGVPSRLGRPHLNTPLKYGDVHIGLGLGSMPLHDVVRKSASAKIGVAAFLVPGAIAFAPSTSLATCSPPVSRPTQRVGRQKPNGVGGRECVR